MKLRYFFTFSGFLFGFCLHSQASDLALREDARTQSISVLRKGAAVPILTQNARSDFRPYIHPIVAPDGKGVLTEFSPSHHKHQTGLYWGLAKVNGREFFRHLGGDHWRRVSSSLIVPEGGEVRWKTVYHLLDETGRPVMIETQLWTMRDEGSRYLLDLEWTGEALTDLTVAQHPYGGLFLRMPWRSGGEGAVVNNARQRNERAEGQRAVWVDVGMKIDGRDDQAHIAIFDHPKNNGYPMPWRVDRQLGVGPSRSILGDWHIARGNQATYRHRFVIYTGSLNDIELGEAWIAYSGESPGNVEQEVQRVLLRQEARTAKVLTGEEARAKMTVPTGFEVRLSASEPMITQPMAFCWDDRGRLWVAENRDFETRGTGFSNSGDSRILILEDTDGDGRMDTRKVFLDGIPFPAAIACGFDGLWLGAPPNLLFVPDRDRDDKADSNIEIRLTGWGIRDRHETLNSLNWGPDGWLYGCQGYATRSNVGKPADGGRIYRHREAFPESVQVKDPQYIDGGVWRYHPIKDRFEVVAHGLSNPWGLDFDHHGQMFATACVIPHLWHIIPGGIYHRQSGTHINPHVYSDLKTIAGHRHRSAHGGARFYLADEFPQPYRNRIFMANIHERALLSDILQPKGSGFVAHHGDDTLLANDPQWVGFSVEVGPDGAVYILDWHDGEICGHKVNNKDTGRIFRLAPRGLGGRTGLDLAALGDQELVNLQLNRNDWYVRRARVLLQQRAAEGRLDPKVHGTLWEMFRQQADTGQKLRAIWALHVTNGLPSDRLHALLDHEAPYVRAWAIQLLCEDRQPGKAAREKFAIMAQRDPSPVVRLYLAAALQRLPLAERWAVARNLVQHAKDADDHNLPRMIWFAVEPLVMENTPAALELAANCGIPLVRQFIARRATAGDRFEAVASTLAKSKDVAIRQSMLEGLRDGLFGRHDIKAPANWGPVESELLALDNRQIRDLVVQISRLFGDARAGEAQLAALRDASGAFERRQEILRSFVQKPFPPALPTVLELLDDRAFRRDAIRALVAFDDSRVPAAILKRYAAWPGSEKSEAIQTLATRRRSAEQLFNALKQQAIPRSDVSAFAARQLQRVLGASFVDFWGQIDKLPADKEAALARYKRLLTDESLPPANAAKGRVVFERTCAACHLLYGSGGTIGPDLTGSNRANLDYILGEIINPSEVIPEGYQLVTITTRDGRTLAGTLAAEDDRQLTLRLIGRDTGIAKSEILSREKSPVSMMPEGLLNSLSDAEVRDLISYLKTTKDMAPTK